MHRAMSSDPTIGSPHGEVLAGAQRRRRRPTVEKIHLVEEREQPDSSVLLVARRCSV